MHKLQKKVTLMAPAKDATTETGTRQAKASTERANEHRNQLNEPAGSQTDQRGPHPSLVKDNQLAATPQVSKTANQSNKKQFKNEKRSLVDANLAKSHYQAPA